MFLLEGHRNFDIVVCLYGDVVTFQDGTLDDIYSECMCFAAFVQNVQVFSGDSLDFCMGLLMTT